MPPKRKRELDIPGASSFPASPVPGSSSSSSGLAEPQWTACRQMLEGVYKRKQGNRDLAEIFCQLPDREMYADYYVAISEPECLDNIAVELGEQKYASPEAFFGQLQLVFLNAKHYNEEGSQIYEDAKVLEDQIQNAWKESAEAGIFDNVPAPMRGGKRGKRGKSERNSATPAPARKSATPAPVPITSAAAATVPMPSVASRIETRPTRGSPALTPSAASPAPIPSVTSAPSAESSLAPAPAPTFALSPADQQAVAATEARLPRWPGPVRVIPGHYPGGIHGSGWWGEGGAVIEDVSKRIAGVLRVIAEYDGGRPVSILKRIPAESVAAPAYLSHTSGLSFDIISSRAKAGSYLSAVAFDMDMIRLFERARRWYTEGSEEYGQIICLQRLYQALTGSAPTSFPAGSTPPVSKRSFASFGAGPGKAQLQEGEDEGEGSENKTAEKGKQNSNTEEAKKQEDEVEEVRILSREPGYLDRKYTSAARWKGQEYKCGDYVHLVNPDDAKRPIVGQVWKSYIPTIKGQRTHHVTVCWYYRPEQTVHTADTKFNPREILKSAYFCDHPVEDIIERVTVQFWSRFVRGRTKAPDYYPGWPIYVCQNRYNETAWRVVRIKHWQSCIPAELRGSDFMAIQIYEKHIDPPLAPSPLLSLKQKTEVPGHIASPRGPDDEEDDSIAALAKPQAQLQNGRRSGNSVTGGAAIPPPTPTAATSAAAPIVPLPLPPPSTDTFAMMMGGTQLLDAVAYKDPLPADTARLVERDARQTVLWFSGPPLPQAGLVEDQRPRHSLEYLAHLAR